MAAVGDQHIDVYTGLALVGKGLTVAAVKQDPAFEAEVARAAGSVPVAYVRSTRTNMEMMALMQRVTQEAGSWQTRGATYTSWGPDPLTGLVVIRIRECDQAVADAIVMTYGGPDAVMVRQGDTTMAVAA